MPKVLVALDNFSEHLLEFISDMLPEKEKNIFIGMMMQGGNDSQFQSASLNYYTLKKSLIDEQKKIHLRGAGKG